MPRTEPTELIQHDKPVSGSSFTDLDRRRLREYFSRVLKLPCPADTDRAGWERLLCNLEFMRDVEGVMAATVDGMLLFGGAPKRFLPQSGIRAIAYTGVAADYTVIADQDIKGPLVGLWTADGLLFEPGLVDQALAFIARTAPAKAHIEGGIRVERPTFPEEVIREVVVNALVHRDYSIFGTDISFVLFSDRLEVKSPGRLPNTATVDALKLGFRYARNQTLVNVMRDYRYVDFRGMGIREKVIPGMRAHNGTEPELIETERDFTVILRRHRADA